ncbi:MAG: DUF4136 domain-containing protein [Nitrospirae bacterium]|nr:DUF4136 domain-containing protein [Nitrospirota bacterium]
MKRYSFFLIFTALAFSVLSACSTLEVNVKTYSDPEKNLLSFKRFKLEPVNKENPLLEKELLFMTKQRLVHKGYIYDEENPDFSIVLHYYNSPYQYYVPSQTTYTPYFLPGETKTYSGTLKGSDVRVTEQSYGRYELKEQTVGGHAETEYQANIRISFLAHTKSGKPGKDDIFWQGEGDTKHASSDILAVAPYLLDEILGEFPVKTGKPQKRAVKPNR